MKLSFPRKFSFLFTVLFMFIVIGSGVVPLVSYALNTCTITLSGPEPGTFVYTEGQPGFEPFNSQTKCQAASGVWSGTSNGSEDGGITGEVTIDKILKAINKEIINPAIIAIFAVALAVFIFGVVRFIWAKQEGDPYEKDGKSHMVWGLVGMFIMASAFGIIQFIANTLTLDFKITNDGQVIDPNNPDPPGPPNPNDHINQIQGLDGIWYPKYTTSAECLARPDTSGEWLYDSPTAICDFDGISTTGGGGNNGGGANPVINTQSADYKIGYKQGFYDGYYKESPETQIGGQYFGQNNDTSNGYSMGYAAGQVAVDPLNKEQCDMVGGSFFVQVNSNACLTSRPRPQ